LILEKLNESVSAKLFYTSWF